MKENFVFPNKLVANVFFNTNSTVVETISYTKQSKGGHKHARYISAKSISELASLSIYKENKRFINRVVEPRFNNMCNEYAGKEPTLVIGHETRPLFIALFEDDNYALCIRREGRQNWVVLSSAIRTNVSNAKYGDNAMYCTATFDINSVTKTLQVAMPTKSEVEIDKYVLITKLMKENNISLDDLQDYVASMTGLKVERSESVQQEIVKVEPTKSTEPMNVSKMEPIYSDALQGYAATEINSINVVRADKLAPYYDATFTEEETKTVMRRAMGMLHNVTGIERSKVINRITEISTKKYAIHAMVIANNIFVERVADGFEFTDYTDELEKTMRALAAQKLNIEKGGKFTHIPKGKIDKKTAQQNGIEVNVDTSYVCDINEQL